MTLLSTGFSRRFAASLCVTSLLFSNLVSLPAFAKDPELTVYNQNFALVKDYRDIPLKSGRSTVFLDDVAALIDPTSVHFKSLTDPGGVGVLEQNFRYDLISKSNILDRMVGKKIKFRKDGVTREGILLNPVTNYVRSGNSSHKTNTHEFAVQTDEGVLLTSLGEVIVNEVPEGLYPRPTLMWNLISDKGGTHKTEVSYLTDNVKWDCDYVAVINDDDTEIDLTGWVTLDNQSGASYENARLKLVAGDVQKIEPGGRGNAYAGRVAMKSIAMDEAREQFKEESFFEYHLYTMKDRVTVANNETKQVTLVSANNVPLTKKYIYDPDRSQYTTWLRGHNHYFGTFDYYYNRPGQGSDTSTYKKVNTLVSIKNSKNNNLGIPLPKGKVRVNKADSSGSLQFVGEDMIDHTPNDETIELYLGDAFDLVGEKKMMNYRRDTDWIEQTYEVKLKNRKKSGSVTINALEHTFGDWKIVGSSHKWEKMDAHTISFPVTVPAGGEQTVSYTIKISRK